MEAELPRPGDRKAQSLRMPAPSTSQAEGGPPLPEEEAGGDEKAAEMKRCAVLQLLWSWAPGTSVLVRAVLKTFHALRCPHPVLGARSMAYGK